MGVFYTDAYESIVHNRSMLTVIRPIIILALLCDEVIYFVSLRDALT